MFKSYLGLTILLPTMVLAVACTSASPVPPPVATRALVSAPNVTEFGTLSNSEGSVTVDAQLIDFQVGQPIAFAIAINTHSVDLIDDLSQIAILRDGTGAELNPTAWEGAAPGGHHRSGTLRFAPLGNKPQYIELVIRGLAKIPERAFRWDLK